MRTVIGRILFETASVVIVGEFLGIVSSYHFSSGLLGSQFKNTIYIAVFRD